MAACSWATAPIPDAPPPAPVKPVISFVPEDQQRISEMFRQLATPEHPEGAGKEVKITVVEVDADSTELPEEKERLSFVVHEDPNKAEVTEDGFLVLPKEVKPIDSKSSRIYTVSKVAASAGRVVVTVVRNRTVQDVALIGGTYLFSGPIPGTLLLAGRCVPMLAKTWLWLCLPRWARIGLTTMKLVDSHKYWFHGGIVAWTFATRGFFAGSWDAVSTFGGRWISARVAAIAAAFF